MIRSIIATPPLLIDPAQDIAPVDIEIGNGNVDTPLRDFHAIPPIALPVARQRTAAIHQLFNWVVTQPQFSDSKISPRAFYGFIDEHLVLRDRLLAKTVNIFYRRMTPSQMTAAVANFKTGPPLNSVVHDAWRKLSVEDAMVLLRTFPRGSDLRLKTAAAWLRARYSKSKTPLPIDESSQDSPTAVLKIFSPQDRLKLFNDVNIPRFIDAESPDALAALLDLIRPRSRIKLFLTPRIKRSGPRFRKVKEALSALSAGNRPRILSAAFSAQMRGLGSALTAAAGNPPSIDLAHLGDVIAFGERLAPIKKFDLIEDLEAFPEMFSTPHRPGLRTQLEMLLERYSLAEVVLAGGRVTTWKKLYPEAKAKEIRAVRAVLEKFLATESRTLPQILSALAAYLPEQ